MTTTAVPSGGAAPGLGDCVDDLAVLVYARAQLVEAEAASARQLAAVVRYASMHTPVDEDDTAVWDVPGGDRDVTVAGQGAPQVTEFAVVELAATLGRSLDSGRAYLGQAIEIVHRLPKVWALVQAGRLPVWRGLNIARHSICLPPEGARYVDAQVAAVAGKIGPIQLERLIAEAVTRFDPDQARREAGAAADGRCFDIALGHVTFTGTVRVEGTLDVGDAYCLEQAVTRGAQALADLGCDQTRNVRRAMAVGDLARTQLAPDLTTPDEAPATQAAPPTPPPAAPTSPTTPPTPPTAPTTGPTGPTTPTAPSPAGSPMGTPDKPDRPDRPDRPAKPGKATQLNLWVHLSHAAVRGTAPGDADADGSAGSGGSGEIDLARVENLNGFLLADQVKTWCGNPDTHVVVRPVIDLAEQRSVHAYEVPDRMAEHVRLRDPYCVFPWCTRRSRTCDCDHVIAHTRGGPTCPCNLAPLCRAHHRTKTHEPGWTYTVLDQGKYYWRGPHTQQWLTDHTGTTVLPDNPPPHHPHNHEHGRRTADPPEH